MLEIDSVHEIAGTVLLPPSPDLFIVSSVLAYGSGRTVTVRPRIDRSALGPWRALLETCLDFQEQTESWLISPRANVGEAVPFPCDDMPYGDYLAFLLLARGHTLVLQDATEVLLDTWKKLCALAGCSLSSERTQERVRVRLVHMDAVVPQTMAVSPNEIHPLLGLMHGLKRPVTMRTENPWVSPLRSILAHLGYPLACVSNMPRPPADPIARRIAQMQQAAKKQTDTNPGFTLTIDFSVSLPGETLAVTLPGDDVLGALLIGAKSLVQRGNLIIENLPAESWALQALLFVRKMGCKIGEQVTGTTSFGQVGSLQLQHFELAGRKTDCIPLYQFRAQLPVMIMIAAYAAGQSIFRALDLLHAETPDGIAQIHSCLDIIGIRHGEMPDGVVLEGSKRYDGFDLSATLPAPLAGAMAVAALKCTGKSTINDEFILHRWPDFKGILGGICKARE